MYLCDDCVGEPALKAFVQDNAHAERCDYCGRVESDAIACSLDDFTSAIHDGLEVDWEDALEFMPADGDDWAFPDAVRHISDVLDDYDLELHEELRDDVIRHFEDTAFAPRYFFGYAPDERLRYGWEGFVEHVSHRSRYLFLTAGGEGEAGPGEIPVSEMLRELGSAVHEAELVKPLPEGSVLYRARAHGRHDQPSSASELGAPPARFATVSSRMSPHGIPMFYAARDRDTALRETSMGGRGLIWHLTLGLFEAGPGFQILDLVDLPVIPSVFDAARRHLIGPLRFLHVFADEVRKPIRRDQLEHLEYVPTQIVAEYFRHRYEQQTGQRVDGIAYRSAVVREGSNVVLFIQNEDSVDDFTREHEDDRKVRLASFERLKLELRAAK
jgi:HEPN/RES N-terminal domain 1/RES domain